MRTKPSSLLVIFLLCVSAIFAANNPGFKSTLTQQSLDYITKQILPLFQKQVQAVPIPDISQKVSTPIGHITIHLTSLYFLQINF